MPVYPGTEPPVIEVACTLAEEGFIERRISLFSHTGTHADAPAHLLKGAKTLGDYPVERFTGRAAVVDLTGLPESSEIEEKHIESALKSGPEFLLLRTGWSDRWGCPDYFEGYPILSLEAARLIASSGLKGVGIDAISFDENGSMELLVHRRLLGAELILVENLTGLEALPEYGFSFSCLPLRIADADGSPVRAVATIG